MKGLARTPGTFLLAVLVVLLVAALGLLGPWHAGAPESTLDEARATERAADAPPAGASLVAGERAIPAEEAQLRAPLEDGMAAPLDGPLLRVVDAATGVPIDGAAVLVLRGEEMPAHARWSLTTGAALAALRAQGRRLFADAAGELRLPRFARDLWVCDGDVDGDRTCARLAGAGPFELELLRPRALRVQVRDVAGVPRLGVPVALAMLHPDHGWSRPWTALTDADGEAAFENWSSCARAARETDGELFAMLDLPLRAPVMHAVGASVSPTEPVVLTLPATGQVRVALPPLGCGLGSGVVVTLTQDRGDAKGSGARAPSRVDPPAEAQAIVADGSATFPFVGLGQRLVASAGLLVGGAARTSFAGPQTAGETVTVSLAPDDVELLALALQDETGAALRGATVLVALRQQRLDGQGSTYNSMRTVGGRLCIAVRRENAATLLARSLALTEQHTRAGAEVVLPLRTAGVHDLGVVTMYRPPLVAAGRVVDVAGQPVPQAEVRVSRRSTRESDVTTPVKTDAAGRFAVRGEAQPGEHALTTYAAGFLPASQSFALGAVDVQLVLQRAGCLTGRVLLDAGIEAWMVTVHARDCGDGTASVSELHRARFGFAALAPGPVCLTVVVHGVGVVHALEIDIAEGAPVDIGAIDLRGLLHRIAFDVVDEEGKAPEDAWVLALDRDTTGPERWEGVPLVKGAGVLLSRAPSVELLVRARGPLCASFHGVRDGARLVMPRPAEVTVTVPRSVVEALEEGESLVVGLMPEGEEERVLIRSRKGVCWSAKGSPWPEENRPVRLVDGVASLRVPKPGKFRVNICLDGRGMSALMTTSELPTVHVAFPFVPQSVEVSLTPEIVASKRALHREIRARAAK